MELRGQGWGFGMATSVCVWGGVIDPESEREGWIMVTKQESVEVKLSCVTFIRK